MVEIFGLKKGASTFAEEFVIKKWPADKIMASIAQHTQQRPQQNQQAKKSQVCTEGLLDFKILKTVALAQVAITLQFFKKNYNT